MSWDSSRVGERPTSVGVRPLGGHGGPLAVVPHPLRASLQLLQPNPQLSLLPAQASLHLLCTLILLLQLLNGGKGQKERERRRQQWSIVCKLFKSGRTVYLSVASTFMWSWARLSRLRVVFLMESDDRGTCFLSCSRQCLSWARLQSTTSNNRRRLIHARDERMFICCSLRHIAIKRSLYLFFSSSLWTDLQSQKETSVFLKLVRYLCTLSELKVKLHNHTLSCRLSVM